MALVRTTDLIYEDSVDPTGAQNFAAGFRVGDDWRNTTSDEIFMCTGDGTWVNVTKTLNSAGANVVSFGADQDYEVNRNNAAYSKAASFPYAGSDKVGVITKLVLNCWKSGGGNPNFRIYDATNALVIAEVTGVTATAETNLEDMGTISNVPTGAAIFELQINRGGAGGVGYCAAVEIEL